MKGMRKKNIKKVTIIIGLFIFSTGLIFNIIFPSQFMKVTDVNGFSLAENEYHVSKIDPSITYIDYDFKLGLRVSTSQDSNCTILILNSEEYEKFLIEKSIENITALKVYDSQNIPDQDYLSSKNIGPVYVLTFSLENTTQVTNYGYYYTITTPMYFYGAILMVLGVIIISGLLAWFLKGVKRYFAIGFGTNLSLFIIRFMIMPYPYVGNEFISSLSLFNIFDIELYGDFEGYYIGWAELFVNGVFPYSEQYYFYYYGPLFILTLGTFAFLPLPSWSVAIPLFLSTVGSGYLVFLISQKITKNEKYSIYGMMFFFFNPFTLLYSSYNWLNSSLFTFFVMLSFYFTLLMKNYLSIFALAVATMYKQFAIIFFPLILLLVIINNKKENRIVKLKKIALYPLIYVIPILLLSIPFLILRFQAYISGYIINTSIPFEYLMRPEIIIGYPVRFTSFFSLIGTPEIILFIIAFLLGFYILLGGSLGFIYFLYAIGSKNNSIKRANMNHSHFVESIFLSIFIVICFQLFYPRGSYKYYLVLLTPFIAILFDFKDLSLNQACSIEENNFKFQKRFLLPLFLSWIVFFSYRYIYQWILIAWCLFYLYHKYKFGNKNIKVHKNMAQFKDSEIKENNLPRPGSVMHDFHFLAEDLKKKKLRRWQQLNKYFMIPLYRARILPLLGFGKIFLLLKTIGWKTGKIRRTPVEYRKMDGSITIFSGMGEKSAWVKNLRANPEKVIVQKGFHKFKPHLEFITDVNQKIQIIKSYVSEYGKSAKMLFGWNPKVDRPESIDFTPLINLLSIIKLHEKI